MSWEAFYLRNGKPQSYCKSCTKAKVREWEAANPERAREVILAAKRRYNARQRALRPPAPPRPRKYATPAEARRAGKRRASLRKRGLSADTPRHSGVCDTCHRQRALTDFPYPAGKRLDHGPTCYDCRTEKRCPDCDTSKPLSDFSGHAGKRDGLMSYCRACSAARQKAWVKANPAKVATARATQRAANRIRHRGGVVDVAEKRCSKCHETKPAELFHLNADTTDGLARYCKACRNQWVKDHPENFKRYDRNRKELLETGTVEDVDRFVVYDREGGRCHICGRKVARDSFHLEHLFPLSKGGDHSYSNVAIAHPVCNRRKHDNVVPVQLRIT